MTETAPKTETKKKAPAIDWQPRYQFVEGSNWWEVIEINGEEMLCICPGKPEPRTFKKSEADQLAENYRKLQAG